MLKTGQQVWFFPRPPSLAYRHCPPTSSSTWVPFCVSPRVPVSSSHKDTYKSHWIRAHSNGLILIPLHFEVLACRALMHEFGADIIQPVSTRPALTSGTRQFRPLSWFQSPLDALTPSFNIWFTFSTLWSPNSPSVTLSISWFSLLGLLGQITTNLVG